MIAALRLLAVAATLVPALALADEIPVAAPDEPATTNQPAEAAEAPEAPEAAEAPPSVRVAAVTAAYTAGGPGTTAVVAPVAETPAEAPPLTGLARRRAEDAASGRAYFSETALTTPRGRATLDFRAPTAPVIVTGVRIGITDRIEIGAIGIMVPEEGGAFGASVKAQVWRNERLAIAAGLNTLSVDDETVFNLHAEATACADAACVVTITGTVNFLALSGEDEVPVFGGLGLAVGRKAQFIAELHQTRVEDESLTLGFVGARFGSSRLAVDGGLGFAVAAGGNSNWEEDENDGAAFPFVGLAMRL